MSVANGNINSNNGASTPPNFLAVPEFAHPRASEEPSAPVTEADINYQGGYFFGNLGELSKTALDGIRLSQLDKEEQKIHWNKIFDDDKPEKGNGDLIANTPIDFKLGEMLAERHYNRCDELEGLTPELRDILKTHPDTKTNIDIFIRKQIPKIIAISTSPELKAGELESSIAIAVFEPDAPSLRKKVLGKVREGLSVQIGIASLLTGYQATNKKLSGVNFSGLLEGMGISPEADHRGLAKSSDRSMSIRKSFRTWKERGAKSQSAPAMNGLGFDDAPFTEHTDDENNETGQSAFLSSSQPPKRKTLSGENGTSPRDGVRESARQQQEQILKEIRRMISEDDQTMDLPQIKRKYGDEFRRSNEQGHVIAFGLLYPNEVHPSQVSTTNGRK
jgi:hypothetical protein